jgi:hypothetical protein
MARDFSNYRRFRYSAGGAARAHCGPEPVWEVVAAIGGPNRYYTMNALWTARELMDAVVGGRGMRYRRPDHGDPQAGDRIDSWEVLVSERPRLLALIFGMKAPGRGVLEFRIEPARQGTRLTATAFWDPDGLPGVLYWRAMQPAHVVLFDRLTKEICRRAERRARSEGQPAEAHAPSPSS